LLKRNSSLEKLVTVTTRPPRDVPVKEVDGVDYYFLTLDEFIRRKMDPDVEDKIVEETEYPKGSGRIYGIFDSEIKRIRDLKKDAITVLDRHGISEMKRFYGEEAVISIFVDRSLEEIEKALRERNISEEEVNNRLTYARDEKQNISICDYCIQNDASIDKLVDKAEAIVKLENELCRYA
jgi:guanylate kinase